MLANAQDEAIPAMEDCIEDIRNWLIEVRLLLNDNKTGVRQMQTADLQTCRPADLQTCRLADLQNCRPADLQTCRLADLMNSTYWLFSIHFKNNIVYPPPFHIMCCPLGTL